MEQDLKHIESHSTFDAAGSLRIAYKGLAPEDLESLKVLVSSPYWRVYRTILQHAMAEHLRASTMVTDVNGIVKMLHNSGMAAGINFAINQIQVLCADHDARAQQEVEKHPKQNVPFRRG